MDVFIQAWPPFIAVRTVRILYALRGKGLFGVRARNACLLEAFFPGSIWPAAMLDLRLLSHVGPVGSDRVKLVLDKQYAML